jgi:hypothetical protein
MNDRVQRLISTERKAPPERAANTPAVRRISNLIRLAYCKAGAGSGSTIVCYLDTDGTGKEITVYCTICGGSALNSAFPRLSDGTPIPVWNHNGTWRCLWGFQDADEDCE